MLDFGQVAQLASEIMQRPVEREFVEDETYQANLVAHGMPPVYAGLLLSLYTAARAGESAIFDPTLERLIGRKPASMQDVLQDFFSKPEASLFQGR